MAVVLDVERGDLNGLEALNPKWVLTAGFLICLKSEIDLTPNATR
jgi:hypothetical protein